MHQSTYSLAGVEWSGWPLDDARPVKGDPQRDDAGFVYIVEFSDGWIKVGHALNARHRLAVYPKEAHLRKAHVSRAYISKPHKDRWTNEAKLIDFCAKIVRPTGREYFHGISYERVVRFAQSLPQELVTAEDIAQRKRKANAFVETFRGIQGALHGVNAGEDLLADLHNVIAACMGRRADGSYEIAHPSINMDYLDEPQDLLDVFDQIAERRGVPLQEVLEMTWVDVCESMVQAVLRKIGRAHV